MFSFFGKRVICKEPAWWLCHKHFLRKFYNYRCYNRDAYNDSKTYNVRTDILRLLLMTCAIVFVQGSNLAKIKYAN